MREAKLRYKQGYFEIISEGDYVICAVSKKKNFDKGFKILECRSTRSIFFTIRDRSKV